MSVLIGIDWGTTSFRAYLFDQSHECVDKISAPAGIMQVGDNAFEDVLYDQLENWLTEVSPYSDHRLWNDYEQTGLDRNAISHLPGSIGGSLKKSYKKEHQPWADGPLYTRSLPGSPRSEHNEGRRNANGRL